MLKSFYFIVCSVTLSFSLFCCNTSPSQKVENIDTTQNKKPDSLKVIDIKNQKIIFFKNGATQKYKDSIIAFIGAEYNKKFSKVVKLKVESSLFNPLLGIINQEKIDELPIELPDETIVCNNQDIPFFYPWDDDFVCKECEPIPDFLTLGDKYNQIVFPNIPDEVNGIFITAKNDKFGVAMFPGAQNNPIKICPNNCCSCKPIGRRLFPISITNTNSVNLCKYISAHYIYIKYSNVNIMLDVFNLKPYSKDIISIQNRINKDLDNSRISLIKNYR